nr:hypothetical protein Q903MT_gene4728 [Picea sitchensis]
MELARCSHDEMLRKEKEIKKLSTEVKQLRKDVQYLRKSIPQKFGIRIQPFMLIPRYAGAL